MKQTSSRRASWTKHTSYPTVHYSERSPQIPAEISPAALANNKIADNDLKMTRRQMQNMHRKSLSSLDSQRKLLEKSMLAYSEKMKDISNTRTNELFREIHTRNASRNNTRDTRSQSPMSKSGQSVFSLPARFYFETADYSNVPNIHNFPSIQIHSPIEEDQSSENPEDFYKGKRPAKSSSKSSSSYSLRKSKSTQSLISKESDESSIHRSRSSEMASMSKIYPRLASGSSSIPWLNDSSDSAYSTASEDYDSDYSDVISESSSGENSSSKNSSSNPNGETNVTGEEYSFKTVGESKNLLTVPTLHVRRRNRRVKRKDQGSSELLKQAVLQRQITVMNLHDKTLS